MVNESNHEINFPHRLLLTDTQVSKIHKGFANGSSTYTKFSKAQLSKILICCIERPNRPVSHFKETVFHLIKTKKMKYFYK